MEEANSQFLGISKEKLQQFKELINNLFTRSDEFLIKITDAKFDVRNFCF